VSGLIVVKIEILRHRVRIGVPHLGTLARFPVERCGAGTRKTTVRMDNSLSGTEILRGIPGLMRRRAESSCFRVPDARSPSHNQSASERGGHGVGGQ
jgi:hypothetical protein